MKRLTLIRHAKSNWNDPDLTDFERPLNGRGRRDAPVMALRLAEAVGAPDLWVSSPALRAITTARLFAEALSAPDTHVLLSPDIYDADLARLRSVLQALPESAHHVWMLGHNPGLSDLAHWLNSAAPSHLPTCAAVAFDLPPDPWSTLRPGSGRVLAHLYPKQTAD